MDQDFALHFHSLRFELECRRRSGASFQAFFEDLMGRAEPSFVTVKPWGQDGDRKCDGVVVNTGTYFQVYAPEGIKAADTVAKIEADFAGASSHWPDLREWIFVWSAAPEGLPPAVVACLQELRKANPDTAIDDWNHHALWSIARDRLTLDQRVDLLGVVPLSPSANGTTAAEISTLLTWLAEQPIGPAADDGFALTDIATKLDKNDLSDRIGNLAGRSLPIAREVERYVAGSVDVAFSSKIASRLIARYVALSATSASPDSIYIGLVDYVAGSTTPTQEVYWAAVGIVTHYFQLCDVFTR